MRFCSAVTIALGLSLLRPPLGVADPMQLEIQGRQKQAQSDLPGAAAAFRQGLKEAAEAGDLDHETRLAVALASVLRQVAAGENAPEYDEAATVLATVRAKAEAANNAMAQDQLLAELSMLENQRGNYEKGLEAAKAAVEIHRKAGNATMADARQTMVDTLQINRFRDLGQLDECLKLQLKLLGRDRQALQGATKNLPPKPPGVDDKVWAQVQGAQLNSKRMVLIGRLGVVAATYSDLGRYDDALKLAQESVDLAEALNDPTQKGNAIANLVWVHLRTGDFEQAFQRADEMRRLLAATGQQTPYARLAVVSVLPWVYAAYGDYDRAIRDMEEWVKIAEPMGATQALLPLEKMAEYLGVLGRAEEALPHAEKALKIASSLKGNAFGWHWEPQALLSRAKVLLALGEADAAQTDVKKAVGMLEGSKLRGTKFLLLDAQRLSARIAVAQDQLDEALKYAQACASVLDDPSATRDYWRFRALLALVRERRNELPQALELYKAAIEQIEAASGGLSVAQLKTAFLQDKQPVYEGIVRTLVKMGKPGQAFNYFERSRARALLDQLQRGKVEIRGQMTADELARERELTAAIGRLSDRLATERRNDDDTRSARTAESYRSARDELARFRESLYAKHADLRSRRGEAPPLSAADLPAMAKNLGATVVVAYLLGEEGGFAFVVNGASGDPVKVVTLELTSYDADDLAFRVHSALSSPRPSPRTKRSLQKLYDALLAPLDSELSGRKQVCFVPDRSLAELPFQALMKPGDEERYLLDDFAVAYAPSITVLARSQEQAAADAQAKPTVFAAGDPIFDKQAAASALRGALSPLPGTRQEVEHIQKLYGDAAEVVLQDQAKESVVKGAVGSHRCIHLATHGLLDPDNPMYSAVALAQVPDAGEDGFLEAGEIANMEWKARLVVLSACETARGKATPGEGVLGLAWSLFAAGVPATVATLWPVSDESTMQLMTGFHKQLVAGKRPAEALREAALALRRSENFSAPFFWAPFVVYGAG